MGRMSLTEIIEELPRLTVAQRRALCAKIQELESERAELELCDQSADQALALLDQMEEEDERRKKR